jgi:hypothetical protein
MNFKDFCESMEKKIVDSYESGVSLVEAEKLAGEFLYAQIRVSDQLKTADLDSRMRKSGLKAIRAALYLDACSKADKKPTEAQLTAMLDTNEIVAAEQNSFDEAEVKRDAMDRYYNIFQSAHVYFRQLSRGQ